MRLKKNAYKFTADLYYHKACFPDYIWKFENSKIDVEANNLKIIKRKIFEGKYHQLICNILKNRRTISLLDIRDLINEGEDINSLNAKVAVFVWFLVN